MLQRLWGYVEAQNMVSACSGCLVSQVDQHEDGDHQRYADLAAPEGPWKIQQLQRWACPTSGLRLEG